MKAIAIAAVLVLFASSGWAASYQEYAKEYQRRSKINMQANKRASNWANHTKQDRRYPQASNPIFLKPYPPIKLRVPKKGKRVGRGK